MYAKAPERGKVINLMDALRRSLEEASVTQKPPAKSKPKKEAKIEAINVAVARKSAPRAKKRAAG